MIPHESLEVTFRDGKKETVHVVEVGFRTFMDCVVPMAYGSHLAEAAVRRASAAGQFDLRVMPDWIDTLEDESAAKVIEASNKLNFSSARVGKALPLILDWRERIGGGTSTNSENSGANSGGPSRS